MTNPKIYATMVTMKQAHMTAPAQISAPLRPAEVPVWMSETAKMGIFSGMTMGALLFNSLPATLIGAPIGYALGVWAEKHDRKKRQ
ncbi:MAG: hypothetical protein HAW59_03690 [Betaproteobacteria bacterium]|nr:hypothetical protein [Betaproteobacteria bacterium]